MTTAPEFNKTWLGPRYWGIWLLLSIMWLIAHLPYAVQMRIGSTIGSLLYYVARDRKRIAHINLSLAFPDYSVEQRTALVKAVFRETGKALPETCIAWFRHPGKLNIEWHVENIEQLVEAAESPQGVLLLGAHFSCVDICGSLIGTLLDYDTLHRPHGNPLMNYFQCRGRLRFVGALIEKKDMLSMIRRLKKGRVIFYAPDQDLGRKYSIFVPFFGVSTATVTATAKLATVAGARVFLALTLRTPKGYRMRAIDGAALSTGDIEADTTAYNAWLEEEIRQQPSQYLWLHKRFKTRPKGEAKLY
ncbi:lysophospholipid acyltransferase family protein [Salinispirillum sp. LH 10-3-1]|uniref:Lysophospholipid acyltransferase family protein n=1 Tax=Salinispirillum sp. LH 10-3-1 TaxID=2952525 RepID=A0AB38YHD6_9GAMM